MRLLHDRPRRLLRFVVLRRGGSNHVARELMDHVAQVLLFLTQIEADHALTSACGSPCKFHPLESNTCAQPRSAAAPSYVAAPLGRTRRRPPRVSKCPGPNARGPAGCRIHGEVLTTKATTIRHDSASIRNDFD